MSSVACRPFSGSSGHALVVDDLSDAGRPGFDGGGIGGNGDLLGQASHGHGDVDGRVGIHLQDDAVLEVGVEALKRGLQTVRSYREVREHLTIHRRRDRPSVSHRCRCS